MVKKLTEERIDEIRNLLHEVFSQKCSIIDTLFEHLDMIRKMRVEARIDKLSTTNILDILKPSELQVSKMLCSFFSYQIGCWSGKDNCNNNYFNYPYWGFKTVRNDENNDREWVEKIKTKAQVETLHDDSEKPFLSWGSTTNGFED